MTQFLVIYHSFAGVNNFVGSVAVENISMSAECPVACRPKDHQDWTQC
jgi:hypothetical protein